MSEEQKHTEATQLSGKDLRRALGDPMLTGHEGPHDTWRGFNYEIRLGYRTKAEFDAAWNAFHRLIPTEPSADAGDEEGAT